MSKRKNISASEAKQQPPLTVYVECETQISTGFLVMPNMKMSTILKAYAKRMQCGIWQLEFSHVRGHIAHRTSGRIRDLGIQDGDTLGFTFYPANGYPDVTEVFLAGNPFFEMILRFTSDDVSVQHGLMSQLFTGQTRLNGTGVDDDMMFSTP